MIAPFAIDIGAKDELAIYITENGGKGLGFSSPYSSVTEYFSFQNLTTDASSLVIYVAPHGPRFGTRPGYRQQHESAYEMTSVKVRSLKHRVGGRTGGPARTGEGIRGEH
ncbi:unnamed protein product [Clavelina lepadiformis]|uniref:Uncharacterized protein n=1 Tax=Clavelina lepadiformis TaxID=159417 RepID=A0ABP0FHA7_CLALP